MDSPFAQPLMGLRMERSEDSDDFDDIFDSDGSSDGFDLPVSPGTLDTGTRSLSLQGITEINNFPEINGHLSSLCSALPNYDVPEKYSGGIELVPFGTASAELLDEISQYVEHHDSSKFTEFLGKIKRSELSEAHEVQLELIHFTYDSSVDLHKFEDKKLDSRILALLYWLLSCHYESNAGKSAAYALKSASEFLKNDSVLPITIIFPEFTLSSILTRLCKLLIQIFPKHPIVPSFLHRMSDFTDDKDGILVLIPGEESDDDFDLSDSFFDDLERSGDVNVPMISIGEKPVTNPLAAFRTTDVVVMLETPSTISYSLGEGKEKMLPDEFMAWIKTARVNVADDEQVLDSSEPVGIKSEPVLPTLEKPARATDVSSYKEFEPLYEITDPGKIAMHIPEKSEPKNWAFYLPLLHTINANSSFCFTGNSVHPKLLHVEHMAHYGMTRNKVDGVNEAIQSLMLMISPDLKTAEIAPWKAKRGNPEYVSEPDVLEVTTQALVDLILIFDGRSPLTLGPSSAMHGKLLDTGDHPAFNDEWRVGCLYNLYATNNFPPYLAFRCAIALAIAKMDQNPGMSCRFFFEGLHLLLRMIPNLRSNAFVRNAFFAFGEAMDATGKYYYCAMLHDNVWSLTTSDKKLASKAAKIAQKNRDYCRAVFYYLHALKIYKRSHSPEEVIYTAQVVASIYKENNQIYEGILLLNSVLMNVYNLEVGCDSPTGKDYLDALGKRKRSLSKSKTGSRRAKSFIVFQNIKDEEPKADAISTIMSAVFLCKLLIKVHKFTEASTLVEHVLEIVSTPSITKILTFMGAKILYHRNHFSEFVQRLNALKIFNKEGLIPKVRHAPVMMVDVVFSALKLLVKGYMERNGYTKAFFWSEILCHYTTSQLAMKYMSVGFNLRGLALAAIYKNWNLWPNHSTLSAEIDELQESAGSFVSDLRKFTKEDVLCEALASFTESRLASDRVGNEYRALQAYIQYALLLGLHILTNESGKPFTLTIEMPRFETKVKNSDPNENMISFDPLILNESNAVDHLAQIYQTISDLARLFMDPILIIRGQIVGVIVSHLRGKDEMATNLFNFAFGNLTNYFFNGSKFLLTDAPVHLLREMNDSLMIMILLLMKFEKEFINDHLIIFDMIQEMNNTIRNRLCMKVQDTCGSSGACMEVQPSIEMLSSSIFPDFSAVLKELGVGRLPSRLIERRNEFGYLLNKITSNVKLYHDGQLQDRELFDLNSICCKKLEVISTELRRDRVFLILSEIPPRVRDSAIFVCKVYSQIISYIPSVGRKRIIDLTINAKETFTITSLPKPMKFTTRSAIFSPQFLESICNLVCCDAQMKKPKTQPLEIGSACQALAEVLFGDLTEFLSNFWFCPVADESWDSKSFNMNAKGQLVTVNVNRSPLTIIADSTLHILPFEFMFPTCCVIRSIGFFNKYSRYNGNRTLRPIVFRWKFDREHEEELCFHRSHDAIKTSLAALGAAFPTPQHADDVDRFITFPFPLCDSARDTDKYGKDYSFCDFYHVRSHDDREFRKFTNAIFLFTYSDLVDWPEFLAKMTQTVPYVCFLFIPPSHMAQAFQEIKRIYKRHDKRRAYFEKHPTDPRAEFNKLVLGNPFQFVATLQLTLMKKLNVPVAFLNPNHDLCY